MLSSNHPAHLEVETSFLRPSVVGVRKMRVGIDVSSGNRLKSCRCLQRTYRRRFPPFARGKFPEEATEENFRGMSGTSAGLVVADALSCCTQEQNVEHHNILRANDHRDDRLLSSFTTSHTVQVRHVLDVLHAAP
jgi:hypothetical protein